MNIVLRTGCLELDASALPWGNKNENKKFDLNAWHRGIRNRMAQIRKKV